MRTRFRRLSRRARLFVVASALTLMLLLPFVAGAGTWAQTYFYDQYAYNGEIHGSAYNSGIDYNSVDFNSVLGGNTMDLSLCPTSGNCYSGHAVTGGSGHDLRTISYGQAICYSPFSNSNGAVYVYDCYTRNF